MEEKEKGLLEINTPQSGVDVKKILVNGVEISIEGLIDLVFRVEPDEVRIECNYMPMPQQGSLRGNSTLRDVELNPLRDNL